MNNVERGFIKRGLELGYSMEQIQKLAFLTEGRSAPAQNMPGGALGSNLAPMPNVNTNNPVKSVSSPSWSSVKTPVVNSQSIPMAGPKMAGPPIPNVSMAPPGSTGSFSAANQMLAGARSVNPQNSEGIRPKIVKSTPDTFPMGQALV